MTVIVAPVASRSRPVVVMMPPAIEVERLRKSYGDLAAVDGLSFSVEVGELVAVLGHNGAGKTTTVEILGGHRHRDSGQVAVLGMDPQTGGRALRRCIGLVLQEAGIGETVTVGEALELYASFWSQPRQPTELLALVGLGPKRTARIGTLSGGQRRRLDLALARVGRPQVLFLDEPSTGLDPVARRETSQLIHQLRGEGTAILLSTHYMEEAEQLADRVVVMAHGRLIAEGTTVELAAQLGAQAVISFRLPEGVTASDLPQLSSCVEMLEPAVEVRTGYPTQTLHELSGWAMTRNIELVASTVIRPGLEDVYFHLAVVAEPRREERPEQVAPEGAVVVAGALPLLLLLLILGLLFGGERLIVGERWVSSAPDTPGAVPFAQVITPAMAASAVAMAGYVHVAGATDRADGTLERLRATPLPSWAYLTGRIAAACWIALLTAVLVIAAGGLLTEMEIAWRGVPAALLTIVIGAVSFAALGLMLVVLVRPGSVQAIAFATLLPLAFISEIFLHGNALPASVAAVTSVFPLRHLGVALRDALDPAAAGSGLDWTALAVMLGWAAAAGLIAAARFSWDPRDDRRSRRGRPGVARPARG
jgi:ABC-2 type transport system ATP-binding protein